MHAHSHRNHILGRFISHERQIILIVMYTHGENLLAFTSDARSTEGGEERDGKENENLTEDLTDELHICCVTRETACEPEPFTSQRARGENLSQRKKKRSDPHLT